MASLIIPVFKKWKRNLLAFKTFILGEVFRYGQNFKKKKQNNTSNLFCPHIPVEYR